MSDSPDRGFCASSLSLHHCEAQQSINVPALDEVSERDKPWNKHKANAEIVARHFAAGDPDQFRRYAQRVNFCADLLEFRLAPDRFEGAYKLKLQSARFCRVRQCPICQWRRSLRWKARASEILPRVVNDYPKHRWLFLTLTVRNCQITELREALGSMNRGFKRLTERKVFPAVGWIRSVEVTRNKKNGSAHPHFHCLLMVPSSYFSGQGYLSQAKWVELWQQSARLDYKPVLDVQAIRRDIPPTALIPEVLKYAVKESDLVADREWFLELVQQLHKTLGVTVGGVLRSYFRDLDKEIEEDLVGHKDEFDQPNEGSLYFGWKRKEKKYRMVNT
jgi:plasmid rolling circle replication initiator protein Rep